MMYVMQVGFSFDQKKKNLILCSAVHSETEQTRVHMESKSCWQEINENLLTLQKMKWRRRGPESL